MSLHPEPVGPIPEETVHVARAAFPAGNPYLLMRDAFEAYRQLLQKHGIPLHPELVDKAKETPAVRVARAALARLGHGLASAITPLPTPTPAADLRQAV